MLFLEKYIDAKELIQKELDLAIELYNGTQYNLIRALMDKIYHMCFHIGSPSSVIPMIKSIISGKLKMWALSSNLNHCRGDQLNYKTTQEAARKSHGDYVKGHFRWNYGIGYIANYETRNFLQKFFIEQNFAELRTNIDNGLKKPTRFNIRKATVKKDTDNHYYIEITTTKNNDYRYFYTVDIDLVICSMVEPPVSESEKLWVKKVINDSGVMKGASSHFLPM